MKRIKHFLFLPLALSYNVMAMTIDDICNDFSTLSEKILTAEKKIHESSIKEDISLHKDEKAFVSMNRISPGQNGISYKGICYNLMAKSKDGVSLPELKFHEGKATLSLERAKKAIIGPKNRIILLDGHHSYIGAMLAGALTFPLHIIDDWSYLGVDEFWKKMIQKEYVFFADYLSKDNRPPLFFSQLINDSLRGAIDESLILINSENKAEIFRPESAGLRFENQMIPFCEFKLARILYNKGVKIPKESRFPHPIEIIQIIHRELKKLDDEQLIGIKVFDKIQKYVHLN